MLLVLNAIIIFEQFCTLVALRALRGDGEPSWLAMCVVGPTLRKIFFQMAVWFHFATQQRYVPSQESSSWRVCADSSVT